MSATECGYIQYRYILWPGNEALSTAAYSSCLSKTRIVPTDKSIKHPQFTTSHIRAQLEALSCKYFKIMSSIWLIRRLMATRRPTLSSGDTRTLHSARVQPRVMHTPYSMHGGARCKKHGGRNMVHESQCRDWLHAVVMQASAGASDERADVS